jgi:hypothetical protein
MKRKPFVKSGRRTAQTEASQGRKRSKLDHLIIKQTCIYMDPHKADSNSYCYFGLPPLANVGKMTMIANLLEASTG